MSSSSLHNTSIDKNRRSWHKKSQLVDSTGCQYIVFTHDISLMGMSLFADKQYKPGQICNVHVPVFVGSALRNYRFNCRVTFSSLCGMKGFRTNLEFLDVSSENRSLIQSVMAQ
ncbi:MULTISPECIES: PilZ domain-containing protein [unclassified Methylophilus]|uniref:PilZ domain-containing protein n=1 Tax=unclassified Methylophilus TaxID=2630143 RepID=UPI0009DB0BD1|nr:MULTISPECIES: PilZ domain-containing protein [unclassified Methylophilus]HCU83956.1 PilZ domain-containing protein [Methylophilus sp.]